MKLFSKAEQQFKVGDYVRTLTYNMIKEKHPEFKTDATDTAIYGDEGSCYIKLMDEYYGETYVIHSLDFDNMTLKRIDGGDVPCLWAYFTIEHDGRKPFEVFDDTDLDDLFKQE